MSDLEKVINGLTHCHYKGTCLGCLYEQYESNCQNEMLDDAIALLKERELAKQVLADRQCEVSPHHYERKGFCPKCHQEIKLSLNRNYCGFCGQAVKWNE